MKRAHIAARKSPNETIEMPIKEIFLAIFLCFSIAVQAESPHGAENVAPSLEYSAAQIQSAFSPEGGEAEKLVLKVVDYAKLSLRLAAYSFTSANVVRALTRAKLRGVDVHVLVDEKANNGKANRVAVNLLVNADIPVRTISRYAIHHDKYIIADGKTVQTGSYNYSAAAAKSNSENVIVVWNHRGVASSYEKHWQSRWDAGVPYLNLLTSLKPGANRRFSPHAH